MNDAVYNITFHYFDKTRKENHHETIPKATHTQR